MQAAEGWEGGEDETDCSFRGFAVVEERNTAVVCGDILKIALFSFEPIPGKGRRI